ncbi:hypothetical protein ACFSJY_15305 [Thalassotalea euphylliae]|uniref:hypothetical protein n=1 Tax=Thalassotalea euphylliae TaxID=1655234 RepID=UPI00363AD63A
MSNNKNNTGMLVVSVDSKNFKSAFLRSVLPQLSERHDNVFIVVADELMVYNRLTPELTVEKWQSLMAGYWQERYNSIAKVVNHFSLANVQVKPYNEFCDPAFSSIFRRFWQLSLLDAGISDLVNEKVAWFQSSRVKEFDAPKDTEASIIRQFVVEETAWSIHMGLNYGVNAEYYPNDSAALLEYLYTSDSAETLFNKLGYEVFERQFWSINTEKIEREEEPFELVWESKKPVN